MYEFICGGLPFGEEAEDPFDIYQEIIKKNITYPPYMADKTAKSFIEQMMNKTPELRLGGSYTALKSHSWFKDFNWVLMATTIIGCAHSSHTQASHLAAQGEDPQQKSSHRERKEEHPGRAADREGHQGTEEGASVCQGCGMGSCILRLTYMKRDFNIINYCSQYIYKI